MLLATEGSIDIAPIVSLESQEGRSSKRGKVEERLSREFKSHTVCPRASLTRTAISFIASHQGHRSTNPKSLYRSRRSSRKRVCRGYAPKMSPIAVSWDLPWWVSGPHVVVNAVEVTAPSQCPVEAPQPVVDPAPVFDPELKAQWEAAEKIEAAKRARAAEEEEEEAMNEGSGATKRQKKVERTPELVDHIPSLPSTADSTLVDLPEVEEVVFLESRKVLPGHAPYIADLAKDNSHLYASYDAELAAEIKNDREGKAILAEIAAQDLEELQAHRPKG